MEYEDTCTLCEESYTQEKHKVLTETWSYAYYKDEDEASMHNQKLWEKYNLEPH